MEKFDYQDAKKALSGGLSCSQAVACHFADALNKDVEEMKHLAAAFGGGMSVGETCGAATGAGLVLGLAYGDLPKPEMRKKTMTFMQAFKEKHKNWRCRDLLGYSYENEAEKIKNDPSIKVNCPQYVADAVSILWEMFDEDPPHKGL